MSSNDREQRIEYWEQFKKCLIKPEIFREIGWKSSTEPHPTGDYWQRTLRTSDVNLIARLPRKTTNLASVEIEILNSVGDEMQRHPHTRYWDVLIKYLFDNRETLERETGLQFTWPDNDNINKKSIVAYKSFDFNDKSQWPEQIDWMIDAMLKVKAAVMPFIED